ncbi:thiamine pyrophosphate-binding protein [Burkholderia territorii]|uniref:thiamine pyrophosphate-binding protein n=1 Tax=Burkholderia territorii TaxID=1503055 RepID=UPI0009BEA28D|nr:thiamine pyrophosphate-dependent enzyme [Burkholderia territorii]
MNSINISEQVAQWVRSAGIEIAFGVPGGAIEHLTSALLRRQERGEMKIVLARSEFGAVQMARGWYCETGKPALVFLTTGPGTLGAISACAAMNTEQIPAFICSAQVPLARQALRDLQNSSPSATDTVGMFQHCTKFSHALTHPAQLDTLFLRALDVMKEEKGPVHLSFPMDLLDAETTQRELSTKTFFDREAFRLVSTAVPDDIGALLQKSRKPLVFVGGGVSRDGVQETRKLASAWGAKVICEIDHVSQYVDHPNFAGVCGFAGDEYVSVLIQESDCILAFEPGLCAFRVDNFNSALFRSQVVIHCDVRETQFIYTPYASHLPLDTLRACRLLKSYCSRSERNPIPVYTEKIPLSSHFLPPSHLVAALAERLSGCVSLYVDAGNVLAWVGRYFRPRNKELDIRISLEWAGMAWTISAAAGAACSGKRVIVLLGDGAMLMGLGDLSVAVAEGLPIVYIVFNDSALGMVKHGQRLTGADRGIFELPQTDFVKIAQGMGARGRIVKKLDDFKRIDFDELLQMDIPTVLDCFIDPEEIPPMASRIGSLTS